MKRTFMVALGLGALAFACSKKKEDSSNKSTDPVTVPTTAPSTTGVTANAGQELAVTGQLSLTAGALASTTKGVLMFTLNYKGELQGEPQKVQVAEDGTFSLKIQRGLGSKLETAISGGKPNRPVIKELYPQYADRIDAMSDEELLQGLQEEIEAYKEHPNLDYVLISYDISGNREAEAQSFQFIGMPTAANKLRVLPGAAIKGDLNLGSIVGSGSDAIATLTAKESINLSEESLEQLASYSQTLKILKNSWMNPGDVAEMTPWFGFQRKDFSLSHNNFTPPNDMTFGGGGLYMKIGDIGATWGEVCPPNPNNPSDTSGAWYAATPAKTIHWIPPVEVEGGFGPNNPFTNVASQYMRQEQYGEIACSSSGMYARAEAETDKDFQFQLGNHFTGKPAEGIWRLKVNGNEVGRWDFAAAQPVGSDNKPNVFVAALNVVTNEASVAQEVRARFYFYDRASSSYKEISDATFLKSIVHSFNLDGGYSQTHSGGDLSVEQEDISWDGATLVLGLKDADKAVFPCPQDGGVQCHTKFGFSYHIGTLSYRSSLSPDGL